MGGLPDDNDEPNLEKDNFVLVEASRFGFVGRGRGVGNIGCCKLAVLVLVGFYSPCLDGVVCFHRVSNFEEKVMDAAKNIEDLKDKLDGVFDLDKLEDCQRIVGVLLRSIQSEKKAGQQSLSDLRTLAIMVIGDNPKARDKARDVMSVAKKNPSQVYNFLMEMARTMQEAQAMKDEELINAVMDKIWSGFDGASMESALLGELVNRMKNMLGLSYSDEDSVMSVQKESVCPTKP
jgi:hypothetical protein